MSFFSNCKTLDELKEKYRRLAKENHPDTGGQSSVFKRIQTEYENKKGQFEGINEFYAGTGYSYESGFNRSREPDYQDLKGYTILKERIDQLQIIINVQINHIASIEKSLQYLHSWIDDFEELEEKEHKSLITRIKEWLFGTPSTEAT